MKTPPFIEPIVNAIGDISITEALDAIDREFAKLPDPAAGPDLARLTVLAEESAARRHWTRHTQHDFGGHQPEPVGLCAHPDCVLVRQAAIVTRQRKP